MGETFNKIITALELLGKEDQARVLRAVIALLDLAEEVNG